MRIAGLDIGTTGCKLTVFDREGKYLDHAYRDYPLKRSRSAHEVDAETIMENVLKVIKEAAGKYPDIEGIGVTSFGETFVLADENGAALHPAMLYTDPRGADECRELEKKLGSMEIASLTGVRPHEMYSISKIMWMKRNNPALFKQARHIFLMGDYVVFRLTGTAQIDYSLAARTMAFDITALTWSKDIFREADIDPGMMSRPVPAGTSAGRIRREIARQTGLSESVQIVSVSHDQVAAAVGAGMLNSDIAIDGAGTVECLTPLFDSLPDPRIMYQGYFSVVPYVLPGTYVCYAFSYTGGALIQWCVDTLAKKEKELAKEQGISVNAYLEKQFWKDGKEPDMPTGLLVLPHFAGAATPYMDTASKGVIAGLRLENTVSDIYRACMEGVVYEILLNMEYLESSGVHYKMLHATGGGAKSGFWMQMKADMLNVPIASLKTVDAGTVGSAMLTGIAVGCFSDLQNAAAHMVEKKQVYYPRQEMHEKYQMVYKRYRELYQTMRPLM